MTTRDEAEAEDRIEAEHARMRSLSEEPPTCYGYDTVMELGYELTENCIRPVTQWCHTESGWNYAFYCDEHAEEELARRAVYELEDALADEEPAPAPSDDYWFECASCGIRHGTEIKPVYCCERPLLTRWNYVQRKGETK